MFVGQVAEVLFDLAVVFLRDAVLGRLANRVAIAGRKIQVVAGAGHIVARPGVGHAAAVGIGPVAAAAPHVLLIGHAAGSIRLIALLRLRIGLSLLALLTGLPRLARLAWLPRLARLSWLARLSRLARLLTIAGLLALLLLLCASLSGVECPLRLSELVIGPLGILPGAAVILVLRRGGGVGQLLLGLIQRLCRF